MGYTIGYIVSAGWLACGVVGLVAGFYHIDRDKHYDIELSEAVACGSILVVLGPFQLLYTLIQIYNKKYPKPLVVWTAEDGWTWKRKQ